MKNIVTFGASNSARSINRQFAIWAASNIDGTLVDTPDLNDFEMPIYSIDKEYTLGIPEEAEKFKKIIQNSDGIILSFAEHNGSYTSAFKNILDWVSRLGRPIWHEKPMFLMATSPGSRGGSSVLNLAVNTFPHQGARVVGKFSLPHFRENFDSRKGIVNDKLKQQFFRELGHFIRELRQNALISSN